MSEKLTVVNKEDFFKEVPVGLLLKTSGMVAEPEYMPEQEHSLWRLFKHTKTAYRSAELEEDESLLQIIPYVAVMTPDGRYLSYYRKGAEGRLHGHISIGFGGHVLLNDTSTAEVFEESILTELYRELEEETNIRREDLDSLAFVGMIYNDADAVGRVHLGLVYKATLNKTWEPADTDECGIINPKYISDIKEEDPEPWTTMALNLIYTFEYEREIKQVVLNKMTRYRPVGSDGMYVDPARELSVIAAQLIEQLWTVIVGDAFPSYHAACGVDLKQPATRELLRHSMHVIEKFVRIGNKQEHPEVETLGDALSKAGFFQLPAHIRTLVTSHLGTMLLAELWVAVRQMANAGLEPGVEYAKSTALARSFMLRVIYDEQKESENAAVDNFVRCANANGADLRQILSMVGDSYARQKEAGLIH